MITPSWQGGRMGAICLATCEARSIRTVPPGGEKERALSIRLLSISARLAASHSLIESAQRLFDVYQYGEAGRQIYDFFWGDFADWYIEIAKLQLEQEGERAYTTAYALARTMDTSLRLLHPFTPFVTEELWGHLKQAVKASPLAEQLSDWEEALIIAAWPQEKPEEGWEAAKIADFSLVQEIIRAIRKWNADLVIAPFFVMPTVSALIWKNMLLDPVNGVLAFMLRSVGLPPVDWFSRAPLAAIVIIVAWQWLPFALLILLTSLQSLDPETKESARLEGAGPFALLAHIILPHLRRAIGVVVMLETIFLLTIFAEIFVTTSGGPGLASTNLAFLIYRYALLEFDIGGASAGGLLAIVLANIAAVFLMRTISRNLET